jgi:hypothetical protein
MQGLERFPNQHLLFHFLCTSFSKKIPKQSIHECEYSKQLIKIPKLKFDPSAYLLTVIQPRRQAIRLAGLITIPTVNTLQTLKTLGGGGLPTERGGVLRSKRKAGYWLSTVPNHAVCRIWVRVYSKLISAMNNQIAYILATIYRACISRLYMYLNFGIASCYFIVNFWGSRTQEDPF